MRLEPYPWQTRLWSSLVHATRSKQLAHAWLFSGVRGLGKRDCAEAFAAYLVCTQPSDKACGRCSACIQSQEAVHPNVYRLEPDEGKTSIAVASVREATAWLAQTGHAQSHKVVIVDGADQLNAAAANALLKSLEEPPGLSCWLLLDHQSRPLLPTVLSRVQSCPMALEDPAPALTWLKTRLGSVDYDVTVALDAMGRAPLRLLREDVTAFFQLRDRLLQSLLQLAFASVDAVALSERMLKHDLMPIIVCWQALLRDVLCQKMGAVHCIQHKDARASFERLAAYAPCAFFRDFDCLLKDAYAALSGTSHPNKALLLNDLLLQWQRCSVQLPFFSV